MGTTTSPIQDPSSLLIAERLSRVIEDIRRTARENNRDPSEIQLIAVSKTQPLAMVQAAMSAGQTDFGENTLQDARKKIDALPPGTGRWHFIGHLQGNKAKYIPGRFQWLHTLDSLELAQKLDSRLCTGGHILECLIQVNVTNDPAKYGIHPDGLRPLLESLMQEQLRFIRLRGLMTIGRQSGHSDAVRQGFSKLRILCHQISREFGLPDFNQLSMGMSGDFREAIAEGSTMVRIGSAIFGSRQ